MPVPGIRLVRYRKLDLPVAALAVGGLLQSDVLFRKAPPFSLCDDTRQVPLGISLVAEGYARGWTSRSDVIFLVPLMERGRDWNALTR
ncbi:hypothetical protein R1flu_024370 [Riccia fluitans]|uniref:Uncharacterized protein n=1 Tax=Riccia fluitans TaxID=41844 RepID=A0ABD1XVK0_9MARC